MGFWLHRSRVGILETVAKLTGKEYHRYPLPDDGRKTENRRSNLRTIVGATEKERNNRT